MERERKTFPTHWATSQDIVAVPLRAALGHTREVDQQRWNEAAQAVLEREIADEQAREDDLRWEQDAELREKALGHAFEILGESDE